MKLDIAPFAYRETTPQGLILCWEEMREIHKVVLRFAATEELPPTHALKLQYWQKTWPEKRVTLADLDKGKSGQTGWREQDDWFTGQWREADCTFRRKDQEIVITFRPLGRREFPELAEAYNVRFRQAMQLRLSWPEGSARPETLNIYSATPLAARDITVEFDCGQKAAPWQGKVEVYNGFLQEIFAPQPDSNKLRIKALCARPDPLSQDHTVITVRSSATSFSFRPEDLSEGKPIWIPDLAVLVSETAWKLSYSPELVQSLKTGASIYEEISRQPEQSLARALEEQPPKKPMYFIVGCEGGRHKFGLAPNGDIFNDALYLSWAPGPDTARKGYEGQAFALRFGWDNWLPAGRRIARGYLPILENHFSRGKLDICQEVLAAPVAQSILAGPIKAETLCAALVQLTFSNTGDAPLAVFQPLTIFQYKPFDEHSIAKPISDNRQEPICREKLVVRGDEIWAAAPREYFRLIADTGGRGKLVRGEEDLAYSLELAPGESHRIVLKIPYLCLLTQAEIAALREKDFCREKKEVITFWEDRLAQAAELTIPDQDLEDFYRALITHILINDEYEIGSDRIQGRVASFNYGNYSNETIMQVLELDRRGMHDLARRHLEVFLHYQGTVALRGNFQSKAGIFYGAGGYECGHYNQHHGWVLWGLAEHYRFTGDRDWLGRIADKLIAGCDWVIREREATKRPDSQGNKVLEYGFLPAGSLEDVTDYYYWISTNALTSRGLSGAAAVLAEIGHPQAARLVQEAEAYRQDLLAGLGESLIRGAVVKLRDGAYLPHFPSRQYLRGRDFGWLREVLEGAITLITTLIEPNSQEATWILKDYEDNLYLDAPYSYRLEDVARQWFSCGGISMQPNLYYTFPAYLLRDQIEHFLRAFFNGFAACFKRDIRACSEHQLPTLAEWAGGHFKTSDEAMAAMGLRMMFIQEDGDKLYLGRGLPRAWVGSKEGVALRRAATYFGSMSLALRMPEPSRIIAEIDPPRRNPPKEIILCFRHPDKARLEKVLVNGRPAGKIEADKTWVILPPAAEPFRVEASFRTAE